MGSTDIVEQELTSLNDIDIFSPENKTLLMLAAEGGHLELVQFLFGKGASPTKEIEYGNWRYNAFHFAIKSGNVDVVQWLLDQGVDINVPLKQAYSKWFS